MKGQIRNCTTAVAMFIAIAGLAAAADSRAIAFSGPLFLTGAQEDVIIRGVKKRSVKVQLAPSGFEAAVGEVVPPSITLHPLLAAVTSRIPTVKSYNFVLLQEELWIVDPRDRRIVAVISK
jgi:hypothetical protein